MMLIVTICTYTYIHDKITFKQLHRILACRRTHSTCIRTRTHRASPPLPHSPRLCFILVIFCQAITLIKLITGRFPPAFFSQFMILCANHDAMRTGNIVGEQLYRFRCRRLRRDEIDLKTVCNNVKFSSLEN